MQFTLRPVAELDRPRVREFIRSRWLEEFVVAHGIVYHPDELEGSIAEDGKTHWVGLATYVIVNTSCELVTLDSLHEGEGIGTALVQSVAQAGSERRCTRLWCITTNDNLPALAFYQKRGFRIVAVRPGAIERARILKPSIPLLGIDSIPLRDEIELEIDLHWDERQ